MPTYYFHVRRTGGLLDQDPQGAEFVNLDEAGDEAIKAAQEILSLKVARGEVIDEDCFEITSEDGVILRRVLFRSALRFL